MRVVSWNIQYGIEAATAASEIAASPEMSDFDVLLLQEMDEAGTEQMARIGRLIATAVGDDSETTRAEVAAQVDDLVSAFPAYPQG